MIFPSLLVALFAANSAALAAPIPIHNTGRSTSGALLGGGSLDPNYYIASSPYGYALNAYTVYSPIVTNGTWLGYGSGNQSMWLSIASNGNGDANWAPGNYTYRTWFDLSGLDPATASLSGRLLSDDGLVAVRINNVTTGISGGGFKAWQNFSITSGFVAGWNFLDFVVNNQGGPTGFRVEIGGNAETSVAPRFDQPPTPTCYQWLFNTPGSPFSFDVQASDANSKSSVTLYGYDLPQGATMSPVLPQVGNPVKSRFTWQPTLPEVNRAFYPYFLAVDNTNRYSWCPIYLYVTPPTATARATPAGVAVSGVFVETLGDTGDVSSTGSSAKRSNSAVTLPGGVISGSLLEGHARADLGSAYAITRTDRASITLPGGSEPFVTVHGLRTESQSSCATVTGQTMIGSIEIEGVPIPITPSGISPNSVFAIPGGGTLTLNEQIPATAVASYGMTVNAIHLSVPGLADVVLGAARSSVSGCP